MANVRLHGVSRALMGFILAGLMLGCGEEAAGPEAAVITEADVTGTWRTSVPAVGFSVKVVMSIAADHSMDFSQKYAGVIPGSPDSTLDRAYESGTWSLSGGVLKSSKVTCRYAVTPDFQLKDGPCTAPVIKSYSLAISGSTMTVVEGKDTYVFKRD